MSDPIGTVGLRGRGGDPALDELALAYKGGPSFSARLEQLSAAKDAHDHAFAQLQLGKDIIATREAAKAELVRATSAREEADKVIAKARTDVAGMLASGQRALDDARTAAADKMADARQLAADIKAEADKYVGDMREAATRVTQQAEAMKDMAIEKLKAADLQMREHSRLASIADDAKAEADKLQEDLKAKLAKLQAVIRELGA
jgi:hypothetical protein